jgi:hypothetical protein
MEADEAFAAPARAADTDAACFPDRPNALIAFPIVVAASSMLTPPAAASVRADFSAPAWMTAGGIPFLASSSIALAASLAENTVSAPILMARSESFLRPACGTFATAFIWFIV